MEDFELTLFDRISVIQEMNKKYDLENNSYIAFSGGKDSTILHYLVDIALPNNKIPRLYINTGIEYIDMVKYVLELQKNDDRIIIVRPSKSIKSVLEEYGYPMKSKEHSVKLGQYQRGFKNPSNIEYRDGVQLDKNYNIIYDKNGKVKRPLAECPKLLKYQFFDKNFTLKVSDKCCLKLKKEPSKKWAKENNRTINLTGLRSSEGGAKA